MAMLATLPWIRLGAETNPRSLTSNATLNEHTMYPYMYQAITI
jgi:hypothetical protein